MTSHARRRVGLAWMLATGMATLGGSALAQESGEENTGGVVPMQGIDIIGATPVLGAGIEREKVPANVQIIDRKAIDQAAPPPLDTLLNRTIAGASTADSAGSTGLTSLNFRGFTASPILGEPQGIAVYQNGIRLNEPFGDTVFWSTIPSVAIDQVQVIPGSNPVFGLNALGGAISLKMKDGFTYQGAEASALGGSFGHAEGSAQIGRRFGDIAVYGAVNLQHEDGWRPFSRENLAQSYFDLGVRKERLNLGLGVTLSRASLVGNGPSPVELLDLSRRAIFTAPDATRQETINIALRGDYELSTLFSVQANAYYRNAAVKTANGDTAEFGACTDDPTILCNNPGEDGEAVLSERAGAAIPAGAGFNGAVNRTHTDTNATGASVQLTADHSLFGMKNNAVIGASADFGFVRYRSGSEGGILTDDRQVIGSPISLGGDEFNTGLNTENHYYGLYFTDALSLSDRLTLTLAGRFNHADVTLNDQQGTALNGDHRFDRFNPSVGATFQVTPALNLYTSYSEANRIPTAAELSCADPEQPCRVPNAFTSDPPLKQVVSRTIEVGARGRFGAATGDSASKGEKGSTISWSLSAYATRNQDDIIFISAGPVLGSGFFQNAGNTQRLGIEAGLNGTWKRLSWFANYGLVRATFDSDLTLLSPDHPFADADGQIFVHSGDRIPNIPLHTLKAGVDYAATDRWSFGVETILTSGRFFRSDESNQLPQVPGYAVVNLHSDLRLNDRITAVLRIDNLFDRRYSTFGILGDPTGVFPTFTDPRFETPGHPRTIRAGLHVVF